MAGELKRWSAGVGGTMLGLPYAGNSSSGRIPDLLWP